MDKRAIFFLGHKWMCVFSLALFSQYSSCKKISATSKVLKKTHYFPETMSITKCQESLLTLPLICSSSQGQFYFCPFERNTDFGQGGNPYFIVSSIMLSSS